jgi:glycosyltransferase involved in cell wall biosynthesis
MISVLIPAWNAAATLGETLASVAAQTRRAAEIIVVDDGSTDATSAIARAAGARVLRQERHGPAVALNTAIAASTGRYLAFIDADDLWSEDKLELQARILVAEPARDGAFGRMRSFLCPSVSPALAARYPIPPKPSAAPVAGAMLVRRASFDRVGNFTPTLRAGCFIDWYDRATRAGLVFALHEQTVLHRRIHPGTLSHRTPQRDADYVLMAREAIRRRRADATPG